MANAAMKKSGHSVQYRKQILDSAIKGFEKMEPNLYLETDNGMKKKGLK